MSHRKPRCNFLHLFSFGLALCCTVIQGAFASSADSMLLNRVDGASRKLNYSGVFVYQQGATLSTTRITHLQDKRGDWEKLEMLDGMAHEVIRHNDDITIYIPQSKTVVQQRRIQTDQFPSLFLTEKNEWQEYYALRRDGYERIAGHDCDQLVLEPRDTLRYGYRLWVEKKSGLLLRAQTFSDKGELLEQVAFTEIKINVPFDLQRVQASWPSQMVHAWKHEKVDILPAQWLLQGWQIKPMPPGFRRAIEVRRPHGLLQTVNVASGQIILSDGLASVSVFIEPFQEGRHVPDIVREQGLSHMIARRIADFWVIVVGEVPAETIRKISAAIDYKATQ